MISYSLPVLLDDCPIWWQKFSDSIRSQYYYHFSDEPVIYRLLYDRYNAELTVNYSYGSYTITFNNDGLHMLFMLEWS